MNCPNCGAEIKRGSLYCEHCGEDIHIVPDFDPEVEFSLEETISGIVEEINQGEEGEEKKEGTKEKNIKSGRSKRKGKKSWILVGAGSVLAVLAAAAAFWIVWLYRYNSLEYQVDMARRCVDNGQYENAVNYYSRALELKEGDIELQFALAETYFLMNNKIEYEYLLRNITGSQNATTQQLERAYGGLVSIYKARGDYQTINDLILSSNNNTIISAYQSYIATEPEFSIPGGYYNTILPLKLTAFGTGKIYYTLDGSEPDENSPQYTAPIILESGDYVVKAYFVNDNGVTSECVECEYHIDIEEIPAPEVSAVSGEYNFPIYIEVLSDDEDVYYTTDGSAPTYSSTPYTGPIPMPLGKTVFKFAKIEEGRTGNVTERTYQLIMNTEFTPQQAESVVADYAVSIGKIFDEAGYFNETNARYLYQYQYVTNIDQIDDFYVISEIYQDPDGVLTKTGSHFAVNAYTGELFKLQRDTNNKLILAKIE
nr:chitobiase/beta-hexosaminidase C-terminal domain-containing protein [uncultured Acetatifactor sp.]